MMSFYPTSFCAPAHPHVAHRQNFFDDLLRELSSGASAYPAAPTPRRQRTRQSRPQPSFFNPKFDIRETEDAYEFYGELPGLQRENLNIELPDPQTLVVSGQVERSYSRPSDTSSKAIEPAPTTSSDSTETEKPRRNSYQATVEDDPEDEFSTASASGRSTPTSSPTSRSSSPWAELEKPAAAETPSRKEATRTLSSVQQQAEEEPLYLRQERSVGQFSRVFTFGARVDENRITASLQNGILSITVPKQKPSAPRRIEINV
ncbi:heat shock-like protein [Corynascus novoguineensis]|uniref:Heat shock-like protein n=1 Tax=Corynascus novoguineensis TaxID=1126955 RepID=A0AAN7HLE7_9PEZI|nr:heat shock-like protein [Corynascus novoguineensis]